MANRKRLIALLIPAHNESLVIENTINSAIRAGLGPQDIYVVDDCSIDGTSKLVKRLLPKENIVRVHRSGKGLAIAKARKKFALSERYRWVHIADADGAFASDYFRVLRRDLRVKYAAATGYVKSLPGSHISQYRAFEYTVGMELHRRFQSIFNVIPIIPGPTSCFRHDVFEKLNFSSDTLTEDFDVTLQIHRNKLGGGRIQFIRQAFAHTQDPKTLKDFLAQITRWNRGVMQGIAKYRIGRKATPVDAYLTYQVAQNLLVFVNYFMWVPYLVIAKFGLAALAAAFVFDVFLTLAITGLVALRLGKMDIIAAFPIVYALKWVNMVVFWKAFIEVVVLRKFRQAIGVWDNQGRRYQTS